jgi:hypothetical protein
VRELGGEIWSELRSLPEAELHWQISNRVIDVLMGVLARHLGAQIRNDPDLPCVAFAGAFAASAIPDLSRRCGRLPIADATGGGSAFAVTSYLRATPSLPGCRCAATGKLIWQAQFKFRSKHKVAVIAVRSPGHHLAVRRLPLS